MQTLQNNLDLFPTNPNWKISGQSGIFTYKTLFASLLLIAISMFLAFSDLQNLWLNTS